MDVVNSFLIERVIDISIFKSGITAESLRYFEDTTKTGINIYSIDERGPENTKHGYVSIIMIMTMIQ
jgi:hypothetical protein